MDFYKTHCNNYMFEMIIVPWNLRIMFFIENLMYCEGCTVCGMRVFCVTGQNGPILFIYAQDTIKNAH